MEPTRELHVWSEITAKVRVDKTREVNGESSSRVTLGAGGVLRVRISTRKPRRYESRREERSRPAWVSSHIPARCLIESARNLHHVMIGKKLAHYEITAHLGSGGMGDVYQASDAKLGRNVAIKILPEAFAHDADRLARFEREARVLASLNHPNIAAIYGLEQSPTQNFLVMELVDGETLGRSYQARPDPAR